MAAQKWVDLQPNRSLMDANFEGYKLSLQKLPYYAQDLQDVHTVQPGTKQFSLQHVKLFSQHNSVVVDPYNQTAVYVIDVRQIYAVSANEEGQAPDSRPVFSLPTTQSTHSDELFNPSLIFSSQETFVCSNGTGMLMIGNQTMPKWTTAYEELIEAPFVLLAARMITINSDKLLVVVRGHVEENDDNRYETVITISVYKTDNSNSFEKIQPDKQINTVNVEYCSIDTDGFIHLASDRYEFGQDQEMETNGSSEAANQIHKYTWLQETDDITVTFNLNSDITKEDVSVNFNSQTLTVSLRDETILSGQLHRHITPDECTWTINKDQRLEIYLSKRDESWWTELIPGNTDGEMVTDPQTAEQMLAGLQNFTSENMDTAEAPPKPVNNLELEDCDFQRTVDSLHIVKIPAIGDSTKPCSVASLQSAITQWLFNIYNNSGDKVFCTRYDVDGLVWQPDVEGYKHVNTFNALGYVQASKQRKQFISAPADCSYVAIADAERHIYLYKQPALVQSDLRNRKTGQKVSHVASQEVLTVDSTNSIIGLACMSNYLIALTKDKIHKFSVSA